jgi:hypothetical protein
MTATPMISPTVAKAGLDAITALFNNDYINIYTGALPASCGASEAGTQLAAPRFGATAFGASVDGATTGIMTATANAIASDTNADATGTAGHFRCSTTDGGGTVHGQGTCGLSTADMILNTTTITSGDTIAISSFLITLPDGSGAD